MFDVDVTAFGFDEDFKFGTIPVLPQPREWPNRAVLCVSMKKKLQFFRRLGTQGQFALEKVCDALLAQRDHVAQEFPLPDNASQLIWFGDRVCLTCVFSAPASFSVAD